MAKKLLGKVVAGAALGGASLLVCAPGIAVADDHHREDGGKVKAKPHAVEAGHEVKLLQVCPKPQEHAYIWSKVTGKVKLKPAHDRRDGKDDRDRGGRDHKDDYGYHGDRDYGYHGDRDHSGHDYGYHSDRDHSGHDYKGDWGSEGHSDRDHSGHDYKGHDYKGDWGSEGHGDHSGHDSDSRDHDRSDWHGNSGEGQTLDRPTSSGPDRGGQGAADHEDRNGSEHGQEAEGGRSDWHGDDKSDDRSDDRHGDDRGGWHGDDRHGDDRHGDDGWEHKRDYVYYGEAKVDKHAKPGTYKLKGSCGEGELVVLPRGGVDGGDGGMSAEANRGLAAGGAGLLGAAALGGLVLLRRRTDGSLV